MAQDTNAPVPQEGMEVYGSDAERLGDIERVEHDLIVLNRGFFGKELYIPRSAVDRIDDGRVVLDMAKDEIEAADWTIPPRGNTMTVSGQPAENRPDALNEVSTTAKPGIDTNVDVDTEVFDDRPDMDSNRRPGDDADIDADRPDEETREYRPRK